MKEIQSLKGLLAAALLAVSMTVSADAPISEAVGLSPEQAGAVSEIQSEARLAFASVRSEHNRVRRALRRAEGSNDTAQVEALTLEVARLAEEMGAIRAAEDAEIRALLTPDQLPDFDAWISERDAMVGSSRDARVIPN